MKAGLRLAPAVAALLATLSGCSSQPEPEPGSAGRPPVVSALVRRHLALPLYPGAQPTTNGIVVKGVHARAVFAAYYRTADSLPTVERYYAAHLPKSSLKMYVSEPDGGTADFLVEARGIQKQVVLASDRGGTLIALSVTEKK